jgi:signal transduction histidine kinase
MPDSAMPDGLTRFTAMSGMAGAMAHDFNNILTGILGNLELLERRAGKLGIADLADYLKGARSAAHRGVDLTQRLLAVSGHQNLDPSEFLTSPVIDELADLLRATLGDKIQLEIIHQSGLRPVFADQAQFEESLLSLARNAREAMPEGGVLRIADASEKLSTYAVAGLQIEAGDYIAVTFHDSGTGMTDEVAARAFEPFFTSKNSGAGAGLGLAAVMGFMRQSRGHARIDSHRPGATAVTLLLPKAVVSGQ